MAACGSYEHELPKLLSGNGAGSSRSTDAPPIHQQWDRDRNRARSRQDGGTAGLMSVKVLRAPQDHMVVVHSLNDVTDAKHDVYALAEYR